MSAIGSDLDVTVYHVEAEALGLHVSVEDFGDQKIGSDISNESYFDSFSGPAMANPAGIDDLILAMHHLMRAQAQQMAQTTLLQQHLLAQQPNPLGGAPGLQLLGGGIAPQPRVTKICPTLPIYDGSGDADDHLELFVSIASVEGWDGEQRKLHFYKALKKTALTWYMHTAVIIQQGNWANEQNLILLYFQSPTYEADRQVLAMN